MTTVFTGLSIAFGAAAFVCLIATIILLFRVPQQGRAQPGPVGDARQYGGMEDAAKLVEALAKLTDALTHAGPAITSAVLTVFFGIGCMYFAEFAAALAKVTKT